MKEDINVSLVATVPEATPVQTELSRLGLSTQHSLAATVPEATPVQTELSRLGLSTQQVSRVLELIHSEPSSQREQRMTPATKAGATASSESVKEHAIHKLREAKQDEQRVAGATALSESVKDHAIKN